MNICITVLIGLPGSGKTTFAKTLKDRFTCYQGKQYNFIHVCYDELMSMVNYSELEDDKSKYKGSREKILNEIDVLVLSLKTSDYSLCPYSFRDQMSECLPSCNTVIVIDDNMYLRSMRQALHKRAKTNVTSFCQVYFKCSLEKAIQTNYLRSSKDVVPVAIITKMSSKIEEPNINNKWEKYSLVVDMFAENNNVYDKYFSVLNESLENPVQNSSDGDLSLKQNSTLSCMTNIIHQSDLVIRKIISKKIQKFQLESMLAEQSDTVLKTYAAQLRCQKEKLLSRIKSGIIQLPNDALNELENNCINDRKNMLLFLEHLFSDI